VWLSRLTATDCVAISVEADMIVKVKEPQPCEIDMLRPGQALFTYLHLAADREQTAGLIRSGAPALPTRP
jgi:alanine dehydrogenase